MLEKAESKEKEKLKEEQRKQKKIEQNFKSLLTKFDVDESSKFEEVKEKISSDEAYELIKDDSERERLFNEYIVQIKETCLHHVKKKKEKKRKNKRSRSRSSSPNNDSKMDY